MRIPEYPDNPKIYAPGVVKQINQWARAELIQVRWLSLWCSKARDFFAPAVGLDRFELAGDWEDDKFVTSSHNHITTIPTTDQSSRWPEKRTVVCDFMKTHPDQPLMWVDDQAIPFDWHKEFRQLGSWGYPDSTGVFYFRRPHGVPLLLVIPDSWYGLNHKHLSTMNAFISNPEEVPGGAIDVGVFKHSLDR